MTACNPSTTEVSPKVRDQDQLDGAVLLDTFKIEGGTYLFDSTLTSETTTTLVGGYQDPDIGHTVATGYFDFSLPTTTEGFPSTAQFDSIVIKMPYTWQHAPAVGTDLVIELHRLTGPIGKDSIFYNTNRRNYAAAILDTALVRIRAASARTGTLVFKFTAANSTLGQELLDFGRQRAFNSSANGQIDFSRRFPGFALVATSTTNGVAAVSVSTSTMQWYGHRSTTDSTYTRSFYIATGNTYYTGTETDRTGTPLAGLSSANPYLPASATGGRTYIQNYTSLWTKLTFPTYAAFRRQHPELTLVKAVLNVPADPAPTGYAYTGPLPRILPWQGSADHLLIGRNTLFTKALPNGFSSDYTVATSFAAYYDSTATNRRFQVDMTDYLLAVEKGSVYDAGLILAAPVNLQYLAPYSLNLQADNDRKTRLKAYFVQLNR